MIKKGDRIYAEDNHGTRDIVQVEEVYPINHKDRPIVHIYGYWICPHCWIVSSMYKHYDANYWAFTTTEDK